MVNLTIRKKSKTEIAITTALFLLLCSASVSFAVAQDFQPPQIPDYNAPPNEQYNLDITLPSEPNNPGGAGVPGQDDNANNVTAAPTPEPQTDYGLMFFAIIIVAAIVGLIVIWTAWTKSRKRKNFLPPPPPS